MDLILADESSSFMCIDWNDDDPFITYGKESEPNFRGIEVIATPCNFVKEEEVDLDSRIPDDCITDPELQFEYLGSAFYLNVLHNT